MACSLTRREGGVFTASSGQSVEIGLRSATPARIVRLTYAGTEDGDAPFSFTVKKGLNKLLIVAVGESDDVQLMKVTEDPEGDACHLKNFFWSRTHFFTTLDIEGK